MNQKELKSKLNLLQDKISAAAKVSSITITGSKGKWKGTQQEDNRIALVKEYEKLALSIEDHAIPIIPKKKYRN